MLWTRCIPAPMKAVQVMSGVQPHTSNPCRPFHGPLLEFARLFLIMITGRAGWDSGPSLCTRQSAHSQPTTMELVRGQGRLRLDKYASLPQRRGSYFHRFVWECKFMCVIPVYYINAPGQNENEYSHMHALAHTHTRTHAPAHPSKVNKHRNTGITISAHIRGAADDAALEHRHIFVICVLASDARFLNS